MSCDAYNNSVQQIWNSLRHTTFFTSNSQLDTPTMEYDRDVAAYKGIDKLHNLYTPNPGDSIEFFRIKTQWPAQGHRLVVVKTLDDTMIGRCQCGWLTVGIYHTRAEIEGLWCSSSLHTDQSPSHSVLINHQRDGLFNCRCACGWWSAGEYKTESSATHAWLNKHRSQYI